MKIAAHDLSREMSKLTFDELIRVMSMSLGHMFCNDATAKSIKLGGVKAESYVHVINDVITIYLGDRVDDVFNLYVSVFQQLHTKSYQTPTNVNGFIDLVIKEMLPKNVYQTMSKQQKYDAMLYLHRELITTAHSIAVANALKISASKLNQRESLIKTLFVDSLSAIGRATKQNFQATLYKPVENVGESHQLNALQEELKRVLMENVKLKEQVKSRDSVIAKSIKTIKELESDLRRAKDEAKSLRQEMNDRPIDDFSIESTEHSVPEDSSFDSFANAQHQLENILGGI